VAATFGRDGRNRDVKRTINGTTTYLIYDGWNLVAEYDAAGAHTTRYIHGPQVDEILAKVTTTSTTLPLHDALGSTIAVADGSGAVLERVYYSDAFGTPTFKDAAGSPLAGTSTGTRFLFTGREWLAALNLYDYRNRTYSAELGRFVQTDPIRFAAGDMNLYRYVANSPVNWGDPLGLQYTLPVQIAQAVAAGLSAAEIAEVFGVSMAVAEAAVRAYECGKLKAEVDAAKQEAAGLGGCKKSDCPETLRAKAAAWKKLADARSNFNQKCWGGGDEGHQQAQEDAFRAWKKCNELLGQ
jgi:RHS repeat-associated protein